MQNVIIPIILVLSTVTGGFTLALAATFQVAASKMVKGVLDLKATYVTAGVISGMIIGFTVAAQPVEALKWLIIPVSAVGSLLLSYIGILAGRAVLWTGKKLFALANQLGERQAQSRDNEQR